MEFLIGFSILGLIISGMPTWRKWWLAWRVSKLTMPERYYLAIELLAQNQKGPLHLRGIQKNGTPFSGEVKRWTREMIIVGETQIPFDEIESLTAATKNARQSDQGV